MDQKKITFLISSLFIVISVVLLIMTPFDFGTWQTLLSFGLFGIAIILMVSNFVKRTPVMKREEFRKIKKDAIIYRGLMVDEDICLENLDARNNIESEIRVEKTLGKKRYYFKKI